MTTDMMEAKGLPDVPKIDSTEWDRCAEDGDYRPIALKWYKYVAQVAAVFAHIDPQSPCLAAIPPVRWAVLTGLINRCVRLMFSNVFMATKRPFRETTSILDRCITESCVKLMWLCDADPDERLRRFLADGLKSDLDLKKEIEQAVTARGGDVLQIEKRMLDSMKRFVDSAGLTDEQVKNTKKLPDLASMISNLKMPTLMYAVFQKQASHNVHGTWVSLLRDYLEPQDDGRLLPGGGDHPMHFNQMIVVPMFLLLALRRFAKAVVAAGDDTIDTIFAIFGAAEEGLQEVEVAAARDDFEVVKPT